MTDRTTFVEINDGDSLKEGYFNGGRTRMKVFTFSDATEETHTGDTNYTTIKTGTLTPDDTTNNIILGVYVSCDLKNSNAGVWTQARVKIGDWINDLKTSGEADLGVLGTSYDTVTDNYLGGLMDPNAGITLFSAPGSVNMFESSYTVEFQIQTFNSGETAYAENVEIKILVLQGDWDTESPSFS